MSQPDRLFFPVMQIHSAVAGNVAKAFHADDLLQVLFLVKQSIDEQDAHDL